MAQAAIIRLMISVIIPTLNARAELPKCLTALVPAALEGVIREVIVADGGSTDITALIADEAGANFITTGRGRGVQMAEGAKQAKSRWLLFLHADTILQQGWEEEAVNFIRDVESGDRPESAAVFRYALDDRGLWPAFLQFAVRLRCKIFAMPYGDQGLLISRSLYDKIGGFQPMALMEDVDMIRRLGRRRIAYLRSVAKTSAKRYRSEGYIKRMLRNVSCLSLYFLRVPPRLIARLYG